MQYLPVEQIGLGRDGAPAVTLLVIYAATHSKTDGASLQALCRFLEQLRQVDIQCDRDAEQGI